MKLASIEKIHSVRPHFNADALMVGKVLGWQVVFRKGDFAEGDYCVFIYPDVLVDAQNPKFAFLEKNNYRVWVMRLRKERSEGLVMPLSLLQDYGLGIMDAPAFEGLDVSERINCTKYEKAAPKNLDAKGPFPSHIMPITDEDNLKSNPLAYDELKAAGDVYITLKADGSSGSFISLHNEIFVCSRRQELKPGNNPWWKAVEANKMIEKFAAKNIGVQFEVVGPGINGNQMGLRELEIRVFNVKNLDNGESFGFKELEAFCIKNELKMAKVLYVGPLPEFDDLVDMADGVRYGAAPGEGIVVRPVVPVRSEVLGKELSVKIINSLYKD